MNLLKLIFIIDKNSDQRHSPSSRAVENFRYTVRLSALPVGANYHIFARRTLIVPSSDITEVGGVGISKLYGVIPVTHRRYVKHQWLGEINKGQSV